MGFRYFGYGSNMDRLSLTPKGVTFPHSLAARLPRWRLRFNVGHIFAHEGGVPNIELDAPGEEVPGVLRRLEADTLALLDAAEASPDGYYRTKVNLMTSEGRYDVVAYVGTPAVIDESCQPTGRYLDILVRGPMRRGSTPTASMRLPLPQSMRPSLPSHSLRRRVSGLPSARPTLRAPQSHRAGRPGVRHAQSRPKHGFLRGLFGGRDMTSFHLKRMDASDGSETEGDIAAGRFNAAQHVYLDAYLQAYY